MPIGFLFLEANVLEREGPLLCRFSTSHFVSCALSAPVTQIKATRVPARFISLTVQRGPWLKPHTSVRLHLRPVRAGRRLLKLGCAGIIHVWGRRKANGERRQMTVTIEIIVLLATIAIDLA